MPSPTFKSPLSGDVSQMISTWWDVMSHPFWANGLINVFNMNSDEPELEQKIVTDVGSYGRQLGRITDAVAVLTDRIDLNSLSTDEAAAIRGFVELARAIDRVKESHQNASASDSVGRFLADLKYLRRYDPDGYARAVAAFRELTGE